MNQIEQTFFGTPKQFIDYSHDITEDDGDITLAPGVPYHVGEGVFNLVVVRWYRRPLTPEEMETAGIPEHAEYAGTYSQVDLGGITVKPVGERAIWRCRTNYSDCVRYALALADRIKQARLGGDSIITRYTEEGRIITENANHQQNRLTPKQTESVIFSAIVGHGYQPQNIGDKYAVLFEGRVLGYIWATGLTVGQYFAYQATHKQGEGETYVPRSPQDGFQPVDDDMTRFGELVQMIHEQIMEQIEVNDMMGLWPLAKVGDEDTAVAPTENIPQQDLKPIVNIYGDYVSGDKIGGDKVGGDKITVGTSPSANEGADPQDEN